MRKITIFCNGQILVAHTNIHGVVSYILALKYIHNLKLIILKNVHEKKNTFHLYILKNNKFSLIFDNKKHAVILKLKWKDFNNSNIIENLLLQLQYLSCINSSIFPLHASAVLKNNKIHLIVGATGSGKTSLSLMLCKKYKCAWVADDQVNLKIIRNKIFVVGGHDLISFRKTTYDQLVKYISPTIQKKIRSRLFNNGAHYAKTAIPFIPEELELNIADLPCEVDKIFFPTLISPSYLEKAKSEYSNKAIFQEFAKSLLGIGINITNNQGKIIRQPLIINPINGWGSVCNFVNLLTATCQVYIVKGSTKEATSLIMSVIK